MILDVLVIAAVIVASVVWFRDHEGDGRSAYEKIEGDQPGVLAASFGCFHRTLAAGTLADMNENSDSEDSLVPGEPERLLLCRYWGMNYGKRSERLAASRVVTDSATVEVIADRLVHLPPFPDGAFACPSDEGARTYAIFAYPDDPLVVVELNLEGCSSASNGRADVARLVEPVAAQLEQLLPLPRSRG
jgi:hypothetical protein